jgi:hypothetical protein
MCNGTTDPAKYIIQASERLANSARSIIDQLATDIINETINVRLNQIIHDILGRFTIPSTQRIKGAKVPDMTPALYAFLNGMMTGRKALEVFHRNPWKCPEFDNLQKYYVTLCLERRNLMTFGMLGEEHRTLNADGRVDVYEGPFQGEGTMIICHGKYVKQHVGVFVLGHIAEKGTAVLVDEEQSVWLYNPPDAVDEYVTGCAGDATLIMKEDDVMWENTDISFIEMYAEVAVVFDEEESDVAPYDSE